MIRQESGRSQSVSHMGDLDRTVGAKMCGYQGGGSPGCASPGLLCWVMWNWYSRVNPFRLINGFPSLNQVFL